ncbi:MULTISPECIES: hypothetical protein [unclassified Bacillus (in: firmicutes)]|uniref:hypothetical protein n=1 Tax=unclassified Bacillus (in: firmicutes) TaxID=185979 RepID=UPI000BF87401|nr:MULTISPECIES: hypothetical protein [unclassified Bacillus (in: firmicutes)]PEU18131.1 hypothetical protein CN525_13005 [Bacillus sp. AFS014408]PFW62400.1 hypothetical protein COL20_13215 [Bacillus sp. AFS075034]
MYVKTAFHNGTGFQTISTFPMRHKNPYNREDIREGLMLPINAVKEVFLEQNQFLLRGGYLAEHDDTSAKDNLGFIDMPIHYIDISPTLIRPYAYFQEADQIVHAQYSIRQI